MPTDRLTREEVERLARLNKVSGGLGEPLADDLAHTCLALMDERDNAAVAVARAEETASLYAADREALWRVVKRACEALRVTVDDEDDWPRLPHEAAAAAARIDRLEATLAVERGEHVAGVTDGWERRNNGSWQHQDGVLACVRVERHGAPVSYIGGTSAPAGRFDTALEAIEAANAARAAEEASCPK